MNARRRPIPRSFRTSTTAYAKRFADNDPVVRRQVMLPNVIAIPCRPAGNRDDVGQRHLLAHYRGVVGTGETKQYRQHCGPLQLTHQWHALDCDAMQEAALAVIVVDREVPG